jgi:hypothetical protein
MSANTPDTQKLRDLVGAGADIVGNAVAGSAIGFMTGGPPGAVAGAITGTLAPLAVNTLRLIGIDVSNRLLSPREQTRIGAVLSLAAVGIQERLAAGHQIRDDVNTNRFGELLEGSLLAARNAYEEKKIPLLANLLESSVFPGFHMSDLLAALIMSERLSYRQLLTLAVIGQNCESGGFDNLYSLRTERVPRIVVIGISESERGIMSELLYLYQVGLLAQKFEHGDRTGIIRSVQDIIPADLFLSYLGLVLYRGLKLDLVAREEIREIVSILIQPKNPDKAMRETESGEV